MHGLVCSTGKFEGICNTVIPDNSVWCLLAEIKCVSSKGADKTAHCKHDNTSKSLDYTNVEMNAGQEEEIE